MTIKSFSELGLSRTLEKIKEKGFKAPSAIQKKTIPHLLREKGDLIAKAKTGTGKTAAFALPIIEQLDESLHHIQALVLVPTRELAIQVATEFSSFVDGGKFKAVAIYGGQSISEQIRALKGKVSVVIGTPGRIIDHLERKTLDISKISFAVLDEADEMLNMGFVEDMETILAESNPDKKTLLFSATMPDHILKIAKRYMNEYSVIEDESSKEAHALIEHLYCEVSSKNRFDALCRILDKESDFYGLIFCKTKVNVDELSSKLSQAGYHVEAIHGDVSQAQREKFLLRFRQKKSNILVATDVAARGIDVKNLTHVINYSPSQDFETYVHRSGRTGRAGELGKSISFLSHGELRLLPKLERLVGKKFVRMEIPTPEEIILSKSGRLTDKIKKTIEANSYSKFNKMAATLLESDSAETVVAALLQTFCGNELDKTKYAAIDESSSYEGRGRYHGSGEYRGRRDFGGGKKKFDSSSRKFGRDDRSRPAKDDRPKYGREDRPKFDRDDRPRKDSSTGSSGGGRSFGKSKPSFGKKKSFKKDV